MRIFRISVDCLAIWRVCWRLAGVLKVTSQEKPGGQSHLVSLSVMCVPIFPSFEGGIASNSFTTARHCMACVSEIGCGTLGSTNCTSAVLTTFLSNGWSGPKPLFGGGGAKMPEE